MSRVETFPTAAAAADAAAQALLARLSAPGPKRLMVTGGRGAGPVYDRLADADIDWPGVTAALSDERFVAADSGLSNERQVRERLIRSRAAPLRFVPLKGPGPTPEDDAVRAEPLIRALLPFDAGLLGMGEDGHVGSLFPQTPGLSAALDVDGERLVIGVAEAGLAPFVPRISLTGRALFDARLVVLLIGGEAKRALVERVERDPAFAPPVGALLRQRKAPVRVIWSPGEA
ncbi:MAG TPA: 6-phosphogluconolactonase [Caulobacteraceae bacterium]|nr:6-phosphogluconolactonase [Caulobacteraceae bacterium]